MEERHRLSDVDIDAKTAICAICGATDVYVYPGRLPACATAQRQRSREYGKNHREQRHRWSKEHYQRTKQQQKQERDLLRERVLHAYGHECKCCGEIRKEFLALDHIDGGGKKHRDGLGLSGGIRFHRWLEENGYPPIIRILCHNCNMALGYYGYCPHRKERQRLY